MKILLLFISWALAQGTFDSKLITAINEESVATVKKLAQDPQELKKKDSSGHDPLYHAVSLNNPRIVEILLKSGASTSERYGETGESILFEATRLGSPKVVTLLLEKNPELLTVKNQKQETPLFEAIRANQSAVAQIYLKRGLSLSDKNVEGKSPKSFLDPTNEKMAKLLKQHKK